MKLSPDQLDAVKQWVTDGATLSEVQSRIKEEFDVAMTYMDVRFLVDDLDLELKQTPKADVGKKAAAQDLGGGGAAGKDGKVIEGEFEDLGDTHDQVDEDPAPFGGGKVSVTVDKITRPGAVVSGTVNFSDGTKAQWSIDQLGRLGLSGVSQDYRPGEEDLMAFQKALQEEVEKRGGF